MSSQDFLRKLKRALLPSRHAEFDARSQQLLELGRKLWVQQKPLRRLHLQRLENPNGMTIDKIVTGYALERGATNPAFARRAGSCGKSVVQIRMHESACGILLPGSI
jgi:hypothetical protein